MKAKQAIDTLQPELWAATGIKDRIRLLKEVRSNVKKYGLALAQSDASMKNGLMKEEIFGIGESQMATVVPLTSALSASIDLYESLAKGKMPKPLKVEKLDSNTYRVLVAPRTTKEKILAGTQQAYLYITGEPKQINSMNKPAGIIAVLGAGNYSSSLEMVKALFYDNCVVVHKPHHLNTETDNIWEKIFKPLIDAGAVAFCDADQGRELTVDNRLSKIYFTGGTGTAQAIMSATETPVISECGGNNPCIVVPGDKNWSAKEIEHQANQIVTVAKLNGGAVCGRAQTIVTSKHWKQRDQFLTAIRKAIKENTPAAGTYYPGSDKVWDNFFKAHPDAEIIEPENGKYRNGKVMLIIGVSENSYAVKNEAFCQIINEVPLDLPDNASEFLPGAVDFCNNKLLGTLGACILIDEKIKKKYSKQLDKAVRDLHYGGITVNNMPPFVFLHSHLTWGGNETRKGQPFVSGYGNFGNPLGFENIEKSVIYDKFMSPGHFINTNKSVMNNLAEGMSRYALEPTWGNIFKLMGGAISGGFKKKDF